VKLVGDARDEGAIEAVLRERTDDARCERLNAMLEGATVGHLTPEQRAGFEAVHGSQYPDEKRLFDIYEEDDAASFASGVT
jgi:hypothetical protein